MDAPGPKTKKEQNKNRMKYLFGIAAVAALIMAVIALGYYQNSRTAQATSANSTQKSTLQTSNYTIQPSTAPPQSSVPATTASITQATTATTTASPYNQSYNKTYNQTSYANAGLNSSPASGHFLSESVFQSVLGYNGTYIPTDIVNTSSYEAGQIDNTSTAVYIADGEGQYGAIYEEWDSQYAACSNTYCPNGWFTVALTSNSEGIYSNLVSGYTINGTYSDQVNLTDSGVLYTVRSGNYSGSGGPQKLLYIFAWDNISSVYFFGLAYSQAINKTAVVSNVLSAITTMAANNSV